MVSKPFRAYPSKYLCWAYRATRYRAAVGPPKIYSPTHELVVSVGANLNLMSWFYGVELGLKSIS